MLGQPIGGVVGEGFIPSVPCCVIVISLRGPTFTDEVSLTCQSYCCRPKPGLLGSLPAGNPKLPDLQIEKTEQMKRPFFGQGLLCVVVNYYYYFNY